MIGTPSQIKKLGTMTAVGVEAAATSWQQTKTLITATEAGIETSVTNGIGTMVCTHQIKKLTMTAAVGVEAFLTRHDSGPRYQ